MTSEAWRKADRALRAAAHRYHGVTRSRRISGTHRSLSDLPDASKYPEQVVRVEDTDRVYVSDGRAWVVDPKTDEALKDLRRSAFALVVIYLAEEVSK